MFEFSYNDFEYKCFVTNGGFFQELFAQTCFNLIDEYAPGFSSTILGYDMLTPPDLEREIGLTGILLGRTDFYTNSEREQPSTQKDLHTHACYGKKE